MHLRKTTIACIFLFLAAIGNAQEKKEGTLKGAHQLVFGLGHTYVSAKFEGETKWLGVVSWSLDYAYWVHEKWAIGLQSDFLNETFKVETDKGEILERENPVILLPAVTYRFHEHFHLVGGAGTEFSKGEHLLITRLGVEYAYPLPKHWEVGASLVWDEKWSYYHSFGLAFTVSRSFHRKG